MMALVIKFNCTLADGIHARPASLIEALCNRFHSSVEWYNFRTDLRGNAKSAFALISTGTLKGDECQISVQGDDEQDAFSRIGYFIKYELPYCDTPLPDAGLSGKQQTDPLPESLSRLNPTLFFARPVCAGSAGGTLTQICALNLTLATEQAAQLPVVNQAMADEQTVMRQGIARLISQLKKRQADSSGMSAAILNAHLSLASDSVFHEHLLAGVRQGIGCARAIAHSHDYFCQQLLESDSQYIQERVADVADICFQLLQLIYGEDLWVLPVQLQQPAICMADELTPGQFLQLDKRWLKGLILRNAGDTSHTVILARSFNIPTLTEIDPEVMAPWLNQPVYLDANAGVVVVQLTDAIIRYYQQEEYVQSQLEARRWMWRTRKGETADAVPLELAANIAHCAEAEAAFSSGAESVGLFRTEMLYMDRSCAPSEDEQYDIYCQVLAAAHHRRVIIRTMDIGGDKPVDYLHLPDEKNPFLGYRAVRIYQEYLSLFHTQLRALLRASATGALSIMIPMISSLEEVLWVKKQLADMKTSLRDNAIPFDESVPLGIMLEVPSVMFIIDQCCQHVDFFSIGSNDLTQYLLATDRDNYKVSQHYNSLNPAFLRAMDYAVQAIHRHGKWVGLCGEFAAQESVLPLLVGLGLDEMSMSAPAIAGSKARLAKLNSSDCRQLLCQAMQCYTATDVEMLLTTFWQAQQNAPLMTRECISLNNDWRSKEEVMKGMTDLLMLAERCRYPRKLEADLWAREAVFSTDLGFGFAIPHSKSEHIEQSTISMARLPAPVQWGDDQVQFIIMLTLNKHAAADQHMRIFSRLARRIMHAEFRNSLACAGCEDEITALLLDELVLS